MELGQQATRAQSIATTAWRPSWAASLEMLRDFKVYVSPETLPNILTELTTRLRANFLDSSSRRLQYLSAIGRRHWLGCPTRSFVFVAFGRRVLKHTETCNRVFD